MTNIVKAWFQRFIVGEEEKDEHEKPMREKLK